MSSAGHYKLFNGVNHDQKEVFVYRWIQWNMKIRLAARLVLQKSRPIHG